jgi:hypothetical protein
MQAGDFSFLRVNVGAQLLVQLLTGALRARQFSAAPATGI